MKEKSNREQSLEWWKSISLNSKKFLSKLQYPNIEFFFVEISPSRIETIWKKQSLKQQVK